MKRRLASILFVIGVAGCATIGTAITKTNSHVQMPSYSLVMPPDRGWYLQRDDGKEYAILTKQIEPIVWQMRFYKNTLLHDALIAATAKEVADDFRTLEVQVMIEEGVKKGKYQLSDVKIGEEVVGNKKFYTMEHVIVSPSAMQRASMYLYFPQAKNNRHFFAAHYFETSPPGVVAKSYKEEFLSALASFNVR